ncbi:mediator of RNA polymerase II transcription subunit 11 [Ditylenchus destructor]|uniref:Mediator of RNA polymerase II transcription subunit 11 n=1 Tax=Ditylenchus destructor TaxID=166010 RepID=A0AAD4N3R4_9BILA|nr:mediator of RNA polymerase II transcription subunit 11 [Ditylenchus destructor]
MSEEPTPDPPSLDQRIEKLAEADRKVYDALEYAKDILQHYDKDRQISRQKMDELYKKYERCVDDIHGIVSNQLTYIEQMCVGAEHQGSTFAIQQQSELAKARMDVLLRSEQNGISDNEPSTMDQT